MSFCGLLAYSFLVLKNILSYRWTRVCLSIHLSKDMIGYLSFLEIMSKGAMNIYVQVIVWTLIFQLVVYQT